MHWKPNSKKYSVEKYGSTCPEIIQLSNDLIKFHNSWKDLISRDSRKPDFQSFADIMLVDVRGFDSEKYYELQTGFGNSTWLKLQCQGLSSSLKSGGSLVVLSPTFLASHWTEELDKVLVNQAPGGSTVLKPPEFLNFSNFFERNYQLFFCANNRKTQVLCGSKKSTK